ncbi:class I SAM-dependent methyltransferase [Euzebya pacifica]|uniref:class I SAM-dependent methyltransferase n=1 Tax=Euzebya pacifica TaxID=1608957 RepID=UPI0030F53E27
MDRTAWDERYASKDYLWTVEPNRFVQQHVAQLTPGTAIDLATGEGRNAVWLAGQGWQVTAVDFSPVGLDKARRLAADHDVDVEWVEADVTAYQPSATFDLVLVAYLQLSTPQRVEVLRRAAGWVARGGTMLVVAHDRSNVTEGHGGPPSPEVCYDVDETVAALEGLIPSVAEVARRPVQTDEGERVALDTVVVATRRS